MSVELQQLDTIARSKIALDRARLYHNRLIDHANAISSDIANRQQECAIGGADDDLAVIRAEHRDVVRQRDLAAEALDASEAEHTRHLADLDAMLGDDGEARAKLAYAHSVRAGARRYADAAAAVLSRAKAHVADLEGRLQGALTVEREHDEAAVARLHAALQVAASPVPAETVLIRTSATIEEDLRAARLTVESLERTRDARRADLARADRDVLAAVDGVLLVEAERVAHELEAVDTRAALLRRRLTTYAERRPAGYVAPVPTAAPVKQVPGGWFVREVQPFAPVPTVSQSGLIRKLVGQPGPVQQRNGPEAANWHAETEAWTAFVQALSEDAQAEPTFAVSPVYVPPPAGTVVNIAPPMSDAGLAMSNLRARDNRPTTQGKLIA